MQAILAIPFVIPPVAEAAGEAVPSADGAFLMSFAKELPDAPAPEGVPVDPAAAGIVPVMAFPLALAPALAAGGEANAPVDETIITTAATAAGTALASDADQIPQTGPAVADGADAIPLRDGVSAAQLFVDRGAAALAALEPLPATVAPSALPVVEGGGRLAQLAAPSTLPVPVAEKPRSLDSAGPAQKPATTSVEMTSVRVKTVETAMSAPVLAVSAGSLTAGKTGLEPMEAKVSQPEVPGPKPDPSLSRPETTPGVDRRPDVPVAVAAPSPGPQITVAETVDVITTSASIAAPEKATAFPTLPDVPMTEDQPRLPDVRPEAAKGLQAIGKPGPTLPAVKKRETTPAQPTSVTSMRKTTVTPDTVREAGTTSLADLLRPAAQALPAGVDVDVVQAADPSTEPAPVDLETPKPVSDPAPDTASSPPGFWERLLTGLSVAAPVQPGIDKGRETTAAHPIDQVRPAEIRVEEALTAVAVTPSLTTERAASGLAVFARTQALRAIPTPDESTKVAWTELADPSGMQLVGTTAQGPSFLQPTSAAASQVSVPQVAAQISAALSQNPDGTTELALSPEELGLVRLRMESDATNPERMVVHITFERPETLDLFRRHSGELADALRDAGYAGADIDFGQQGSGSGTQDRAPSPTTQDHGFKAFGPQPDLRPPEPSPRLIAGASLDLRL